MYYSLETYGFAFRTLCLPKITTHAIRHPLGFSTRRRPLWDLDTSFRNPGNERADRSCWGATLKTSGETMPCSWNMWNLSLLVKKFGDSKHVFTNAIKCLVVFSFIVEGKNCNPFFWKTWSPFSFCMRFLGVELEQRGRLLIFPYLLYDYYTPPYRQYLFCCRCTQSSILSVFCLWKKFWSQNKLEWFMHDRIEYSGIVPNDKYEFIESFRYKVI